MGRLGEMGGLGLMGGMGGMGYLMLHYYSLIELTR